MNKITWNIEEFESLSSTNNALRENAELFTEGKVYIARTQSAGKGSKGRTFISAHGGLYLSLLLKPKAKGFSATGITALTAVAMSDAIEEVFGLSVGIKWVNDLIYKKKKVGGILVEGKADSNGFSWVIVGVGVNIVTPTGGFDEEIKHVAGSLVDNASEQDRQRLISVFLDKFNEYYSNFDKGLYKSKYKSKSVVLGKIVTVNTNNGAISGVASDIDSENRLVVKNACEEHVFSSGEVVKVDYER